MKHLIFSICLITVCAACIVMPTRATLNGGRSRENNYDSSSGQLNRPAFYKAMREDDKDLVNAQLTVLNSVPLMQHSAFMGAMTMKKAGLAGGPVTKLSLFKQGHKMLEEAIQQNPNNAEYRFLRLMIQENAPGYLGYKSDEEKDSEYIRKVYKSLLPEVQSAITDYNKKSKLLKLQVS